MIESYLVEIDRVVRLKRPSRAALHAAGPSRVWPDKVMTACGYLFPADELDQWDYRWAERPLCRNVQCRRHFADPEGVA